MSRAKLTTVKKANLMTSDLNKKMIKMSLSGNDSDRNIENIKKIGKHKLLQELHTNV
jgi:hypothetical protein